MTDARPFNGKTILITGGTGSLGKALLARLLSGSLGDVDRVVIFSRDEDKQHQMRLDAMHARVATDEVIFDPRARAKLDFRIGDVRDVNSLSAALHGVDVVVHAAALKQAPNCEYFPVEAARTNVDGAAALVEAIRRAPNPPECVIGVSTDKAVKPIGVMGMTKALQERILTTAGLHSDPTRFVVTRYGNVIASRGSVVPLFRDQIKRGGPVTITDARMTRFLATLAGAVDTIVAAYVRGKTGETWVPRLPAARIADIAAAMIGERKIPITFTGARPGEKLHEVLVSEDEVHRCSRVGNFYVLAPMLPELRTEVGEVDPVPFAEYSSKDANIEPDAVRALLDHCGVLS